MIKFYPITNRDFEKTQSGKEMGIGQTVLIKINRAPGYYICIPYLRRKDRFHSNDYWFFEEASGEQYFGYPEEEVLGWMPITKLDKISIEEKDNKI